MPLLKLQHPKKEVEEAEIEWMAEMNHGVWILSLNRIKRKDLISLVTYVTKI